MVAYTYGPLLGVLLAALIPWRTSCKGLIVGTLCSICLVAFFRPELGQVLEWLRMDSVGATLADWKGKVKLASEWFFPLNACLTLGCGLLGGLLSKQENESEP